MKSRLSRASARDRRQLPRIDIELPATLELDNGDCVGVRVFNISPEGMQVRCSRPLAASLCPAKRWTADGAPSLRARFRLPLRGTTVPLEVRCRIRHLNLLPKAPPDAEVAIGLEFRRFQSDGHLRRFVAFIEQQLVPAEDYDVYLRGRGSRAKENAAR